MEELKILITASTSAAKKAIKDVKDEIDKTGKSADKNGKSISQAMKSVAKYAAIAVGAIVAVTGALAALGKSAQEVNKGIEKLNTAFKSAGGNTAQAKAAYKELFGILGDNDRTIETAQSLARVTTEADKLSEYYTILAGSASKYGDGLSPETLSENIAETIAQSKAIGDLERVLVEAGINIDAFNNSLSQAATTEERELIVRNALNGALGAAGKLYIAANQATIQYNQSQANLNLALAQAARYTTPLLTAINNLGASLLTVLSPALQTVSIYLTAFIQLLAEALQWVGSFFGLFSSKTSKTAGDVEGYKKAMKNYLNSLSSGFNATGAGIDSNLSKLKELKKQTMGFDELNVVSKPDAGGGGGSGGAPVGGLGGLAPMPNPEDYGIDFGADFENITKEIENAKEKLKGILTLAGLVGGAIGLWKLTDFITNLWDSYKIVKDLKDKGVDLDEVWNQLNEKEADAVLHLEKMKKILKTVGGYMMIIAGALLLIDGYSDAWANGIDWANFAEILAGIGLIAGGIALVFGTVAAGVALLVGGIALLVVGIKDLSENGFSLEAALAVVAGVILVCVGAVLAFNAALLANPITWVVIAIAALVAAIALCIIYWDDVKLAASKAWEWIKEKWSVAAEWFGKVWDGIVEAFSNIKEWFSEKFSQAWEAIKSAWSAVKQWFKDLWAGICEVFNNIKEWFKEKFDGAWQGIKNAWGNVTEWFKNIWSSLTDTFGKVKEWFKEKFENAWQAIKDVFSNFSSYFSDLWSKIKNTFSELGTKIGDAIGNAVKSGINSVIGWVEKTINKAIGLINGAIDIINKLPGVNVGKLSKLSLPRLAKGGVVDTATIAMIGEAGKEAVVPLENNTEWMDKLADRIASRSNTPTKLILKVGEKELGWATIGAINGITQQTGELQLAL